MRSPLLWLALTVHLVLASSYAWCTPSFEGPDENSHYEYAWHLANARQLPLTQTKATELQLPQTEGAVLGHHPPLYYALVAAGMVAMGRDDTVFGPMLNPKFGAPGEPSRYLRFLHEQNANILLSWLRMISVVLGAVTIVCVHRLARVCCPQAPRVADLAAMLVACLPMWSALHGLLNSDVLATTLSSLTLLLLVTMLRMDRVTKWHGAALGVLLGLAWLTKLTTLFLGGMAGLVVLVLLCRKRVSFATLAITSLLALVICGWVFWRNYSLYQDPLALSAHDAAFQPIPKEMRWHYIFGSAPWPDAVPSFLPTVFRSLLGRFGWFSRPPHAALVIVSVGVTIAAVLGLLWARFGRDRRCQPFAMSWLLLACALVFAGALYFNLSAPQPQGRLLFPAIAPAAVLLAAGLVRISAGLRHRRILLALLPTTALLVFFQTFLPALHAGLAPAPIEQRSLVGGIVHDAVTPSILWTLDASPEPLLEPPTLQWRDDGAPEGTRYTLYASDDDGRVWLATHEWAKDAVTIRGTSWRIAPAVWAFLPRGRALTLKLRRIPATALEDPATLPASPGYRLTRQ